MSPAPRVFTRTVVLVLLATALLAATGCAVQPSSPSESSTQGARERAADAPAGDGEPDPAADEAVATAEPPQEDPAPPERAIPEDSVYPLLLAEFALRRRHFDTALEAYLEQARVLGDTGVAMRATQIAQYMQQEEAALDAARLWLELEPESTEAEETLATLLVRSGRNAEAVRHLGSLARREGQAKFPMLLSQFSNLSPRQQAELARELAALEPDLGEDVSLLLTRALIAEQRGLAEEAMALAERIFELDPWQQQALLLEARLLLAQEDPPRKPYARISDALKENPEQTELRLQYARLLTRDNLPEARRQFEILSAESPRDGDLLFSLALLNREMGDRLTAKAYLRQMLDLGQRPDEGHFFLGRIAEDEGDVKTAIEEYRQVSDGKDFFAATQRIAVLMVQGGRGEELASYFDRLRQRHPDRAERLYGLQANILEQQGELKESLLLLTEAIGAMPDATSLRYSRSIISERLGDIALAERDLRAILKRDPDNATALNALGYTLTNRTDRHSEALQLIRRALKLQPGEPAILDSMGWVLYKLGEYEKALDFLTRAYAAFPDPEVAAHLGEVLWMSGDQAAARNIWRGGLEKDADHTVLRETLERLGVSDLP